MSAVAAGEPVSYAWVGDAEGLYREEIDRAIAAGARRICDVGGGASPALRLARIEKEGLDYVVFDVSGGELQEAPEGYETFEGSILDDAAVAALLERHGPFDLVVTRWAAEHMPDGRHFHANVYRLLAPGGRAVHIFPTLYALPFLVNRLLPDRTSWALLLKAYEGRTKKFPAYYSWCRGPSARQLARLRSVGYEIERYVGFYGHGFYTAVEPVAALHRRIVRWLVGHPVPALTSFAVVVLRRPS
jgi:SAM-dependent methyltransferase